MVCCQAQTAACHNVTCRVTHCWILFAEVHVQPCMQAACQQELCKQLDNKTVMWISWMGKHKIRASYFVGQPCVNQMERSCE